MAKGGKKRIPEFQCSCEFDPCCKSLGEDGEYDYVGRTSLRSCVKMFNEMGFGRSWFTRFQVNYKPKRIGDWEIHSYKVDDIGAFIHNAENPDPGRWIVPGNYTSLLWHGGEDSEKFPAGQTIMSDTPAEIADHLEFMEKANGRILINGLGLGVAVNYLLSEEKRKCVEHIDVVEMNGAVISLMAPYFKDDPKLTIHHADAYEIKWPVNTFWNYAWHDIWYEINPDDLKLQNRLHRKYQNHVGWQDSWHRTWMQKYMIWERRQKREGKLQ
jgi:hypothetical protein